MYKRASKALQHANRVNMPFPTGGYIGAVSTSETDYIPSADNMSLSECQSEKRQLRLEQVKLEAALGVAKVENNNVQINHIGQQIAVICQRSSLVSVRMDKLQRESREHQLGQAVKDMCPPELARRIFDYANGVN